MSAEQEQRLAEIEARWNDLFPAPWYEAEPYFEDEEPEAIAYDWDGVEAEIATVPSKGMRDAIINARDDVPWLCAQLRSLLAPRRAP